MTGIAILLFSSLLIPLVLRATTLTVKDHSFAIDGKPVFLLGMSYYGALGASESAIRKDFVDLKRRGFNWIRVWATWAANENNVAAVTPAGKPRKPFFEKLVWLVGEADRLGIVVDVTLSRGNGAVAPAPLLGSHRAHITAVEAITRAIAPHRNAYINVGNERNIRDRRHVTFAEIRELRDAIKRVDPKRLVTASHAGDMSRDDVKRYLGECKLDFLSPHRPRNRRSPGETATKTREYLSWIKKSGRVVPLHYQEPFRRDFSRWQPNAIDFLIDAIGARRAGAAGWCLHNGSPRREYRGTDRSFDMRRKRLFDQLDPHERHVADRVALLAGAGTKTWITLFEKRWYLDGTLTHAGSAAEGLLMNVRMVNSVFEDLNKKTVPAGFDPEKNSAGFIAALPDYLAHGVRAFTISLQGGMPGYEGAINSAFTPTGELRSEYLERVERVIRACDRAGAAVILCLYYQRQDQILENDDAVRTGVVNAARWVRERGFGNVLIEIANEYPHGGFNRKSIKDPAGIAGLIHLTRKTVPGLLVSASGLGNGKNHDVVAEAADFLLIHFNGTPVAKIPDRVAALERFGKAIVCNEDDKSGEEGARAARASVRSGCSWGLMLNDLNQYVPFVFNGHRDDPIIYRTLKELTGGH